ncbi:hypothetical protein niasHT_035126 [Heterodera trifolii]|uniref:Uncharacterized protein n=1 Tax=Heterodera trifolii TaxID=157864 RepID=A0ABD2IH03_9BILA
MNLTLFFNIFTAIALMQLFIDHSNAAVECQLDGVCKDKDGDENGVGTVCENCQSCTFKNCCNKVYTSEYAECKIEGWKSDKYKGNVPVDIGATKKRGEGCTTDSNPCEGEGYKCVAYNKGDTRGFCWKGPQGEGGNELFALAIAIAGLVILL